MQLCFGSFGNFVNNSLLFQVNMDWCDGLVLRFILCFVIKLKLHNFLCTVCSLNLALEVCIAYKIGVIDLVMSLSLACQSIFR